MTEQQRIDAVVESMKKPPRKKEDTRPFWKRLLYSIRPSFKGKYADGEISITTEIKGGTDF